MKKNFFKTLGVTVLLLTVIGVGSCLMMYTEDPHPLVVIPCAQDF